MERGDERDEAYGVAGAVHSTTDRHVAMGGHLFVQFGSASRAFPDFLPTSGITLSGVQVSYAKMVSIAIGGVSVAGLYAFLRLSRLGVAMRAVGLKGLFFTLSSQKTSADR